MTAKEILMFVNEQGLTNDQYSIVNYDECIYMDWSKNESDVEKEFVNEVISQQTIILGGHFHDGIDYWIIFDIKNKPANYPADIVLLKDNDQIILCYALR